MPNAACLAGDGWLCFCGIAAKTPTPAGEGAASGSKVAASSGAARRERERERERGSPKGCTFSELQRLSLPKKTQAQQYPHPKKKARTPARPPRFERSDLRGDGGGRANKRREDTHTPPPSRRRRNGAGRPQAPPKRPADPPAGKARPQERTNNRTDSKTGARNSRLRRAHKARGGRTSTGHKTPRCEIVEHKEPHVIMNSSFNFLFSSSLSLSLSLS